MRKIRFFLKMTSDDKNLFIEAYLLLFWGRLLKWISFSKISTKLGLEMTETSYEIAEENKRVLRQVSQMIHLASKYTFWESECLVKAYAAMKMLKKRRIDSTLYLGTGKDKMGNLIAHAWLRSGPFFITGFEGRDRFTVVATFANYVSLRS